MELMNNWRKRMSERRAIRRLVALLAVGGVSMTMMGEALAAEPEAAKPAEAAETPKYMLEDVVVTAERIPTKRMDTPANVAVVTAEEIEENHYSDVAEALSHINGVTVNRQGSFDNVTLNGDERVVIMVDGRRVNNDQGFATGKHRTDLRMIPSMKNIERIEVVKGSGSTLYGSDAVGGVINIITKQGKKQETTLDVNFGSWGTQNYEITTQGSDGRLSWFLTGGLQKRDHASMKLHGSNISPSNSDIDDNSFSLRLDNAFDSDESNSLRFVFEHKTKHENQYYNTINNNPWWPDHMRSDVFNNLELSYHFKENQKTPGFLRVFQNYRVSTQDSRMETKMWGVDYQNGWNLGKNNTLVAGAEYHQSISGNPDPINGADYDDKKLLNTSIYLEDTWKIDGKWSLVPGIRFDHHDEYGSHWIPRVSVNYNANDKTQVYASYGRVFRAPTTDDLYWAFMGNPDLKAETGVTANIGINHRFNDNISVGVNFFNTSLSDAIGYDPNAGWKAYNKYREERRGMEITFRHKLSDAWSYDLGYSYLNQKSSTAQQAFGYDPSNRMPNGYRVGVHYKRGGWHANLFGTFVTGLGTTQHLTRQYALIDFNLSYDVTTQAKVYFKALNLTNQEYSAYPGNPNGGAYPGLGRFFQLGVSYSF